MNNPSPANTTIQIAPPNRFEHDDFMALSYEERIKVSPEQLPDEILYLLKAERPLGIKYGARLNADGAKVAPHGMALSARWENRDTIVPPRPYLVKKLLPKTGVALLSGVSGSGKSFITLDLAGSLAVGRPFFGQQVKYGGTLILASEAYDTQDDRLKSFRQGKLVGEDFWGDEDYDIPAKLPISYAPLDCISEKNFDEIMEFIKFTNLEMIDNFSTTLKLVVIDTFAAASGLEDENSSTQVTGAMKLLHRLAKESGTLVMPVVHHGKNELNGVRGSSAFEASADARLTVSYVKNTDGKVTSRNLVLGKSRYEETGWSHDFELVPFSIGTDEDGDDITSCYVVDAGEPEKKVATVKGAKTAKHQEDLLAALDIAASVSPREGRWVPVSMLKEQFASCGRKMNMTPEARRKQYERVEKKAEQDGVIDVKNSGSNKMVRRRSDDELIFRT